MGTQQGLRAGHVLALMGALGALASLWRPWYAVDVPPALRDAIASEGARASAGGSLLGQLAQSVAAMLPASMDVTGWDAMDAADVVLCIGCAAVAALVVAAAGALGGGIRVDSSAAARLIAGLGAGGLVLVAWHLVARPGADAVTRAGFEVHVGQGGWIALGGCLAMAIGGALARATPAAAAPAIAQWPLEVPSAPVEDRSLTSVAPPCSR